MRVLVLPLVGLVLALSACGSDGEESAPKAGASSAQPSKASTFDVKGLVLLSDEDMTMPAFDEVLDPCDFDAVCSFPAGEPCEAGSEGYGDIAEGASVAVLDDSGKAIGLGSLGPGGSKAKDDVWEDNGNYPPCMFGFTVSDVPEGGSIYAVQVGNRSPVRFTRADASGLILSIGD